MPRFLQRPSELIAARHLFPDLAIALAVLAAALLLTNPSATGYYHDDGIYLTTARSLAEGRGLRLDGVPGTPAPAKYPPIYPLALAAAWKANSDFPANLRLLKAVNAIALALTILAFGRWLAGLPELSRASRLTVLVLLATAPGFLSFADVVLAEPLYGMLVIAALLAAKSSRRWTIAATFAALACLTRSVGVSLVVAILVPAVRHARWRALPAVVVALAIVAPWVLWSLLAPAVPNELLDYYLRYETSAWQILAVDPGLAGQVFASNALALGVEAPRVWGLGSGFALLATVPLAGIGVYRLIKSADAPGLELYLPLYLALVLGHPFPFARYLVPLTPFVTAALVVGATCAARRIGPVAWTPVVLALAVHVAWLAHFATVVPTGRHYEIGRAVPYQWEGFDRTAAWLREHTRPDAVLASAHDQLYALYTRRKAIRPWLHPVTLTRAAQQRRLSGNDLLSDLRALGVTHLVVDPLLIGAEEDRANIRAVLDAGGPRWHEVYRDQEGAHVVYEYFE
jgi:hypothetical protein